MAKIILAANPGSRTRKYALYRGNDFLLSMYFETDGRSNIVNIATPDNAEVNKLTTKEFAQPLSYFLIWANANDIIENESAVEAVGLRFVAPGTYFQEDHELNEDFVNRLSSVQNKAPLHISATLREAKEIMEFLPHAQHFAISDSAFHGSMPSAASSYSLPREDVNKYDLHRFGYHGISVQSTLTQLSELAGGIHDKIIVCHLGSGSSVTAIKAGKSFDTTMGYSPLEGLPMSTRAGDISLDAAFELMTAKNLSPAQLQNYLSTKSGLAGMSGTDGDIRKLLDLHDQSHSDARAALDHYVYSIKKRIGSFIAAMNGLDILVFTGTAGYRSARLRDMICSEMDTLDIELDSDKNNTLDSAGFINSDGHTGVAVIKTDELREIAEKTLSQ